MFTLFIFICSFITGIFAHDAYVHYKKAKENADNLDKSLEEMRTEFRARGYDV
jgi:Na+-transporting NADH:ubiquinone oxidoreductase subunit NqrC